MLTFKDSTKLKSFAVLVLDNKHVLKDTLNVKFWNNKFRFDYRTLLPVTEGYKYKT